MSIPGQLDLFDALAEIETEQREQRIAIHGIPHLFATSARGLAARQRAVTEWANQWGHFGCYRISHGFHAATCSPHSPADRCQPTVMAADLGCEHFHEDCQCVGAVLWLGVCRGCDWESTHHRTDESAAVADALDHAHPGWRQAPVIDRPRPYEGAKAIARWDAEVRELYGERPEGFPIITCRQGPHATRAVPTRSPWRGYDVAADTLHTGHEGASS